MQRTTFTKLPLWQQELLLQAESVMHNAYNLSSHYYVGSALLTTSGKIFKGTFAENSSLGGTICAERAAVLCANTNGERKFKAIAVIGAHEKGPSKEVVAPCGICRQFLYDFSVLGGKDICIICSNTKKTKIVITSIRELLPLPFGPQDVGFDYKRFQ